MQTFIDIAGGIATAVCTACAPIIAVALLRKVGLDKDAAANQALTMAITRGAGLMIAEGVKLGDPLLANFETKNAAYGVAANYISAAAGDAVKRLGVSNDLLSQKLQSQLALTLHVPMVATVPAALLPHPEGVQATATEAWSKGK